MCRPFGPQNGLPILENGNYFTPWKVQYIQTDGGQERRWSCWSNVLCFISNSRAGAEWFGLRAAVQDLKNLGSKYYVTYKFIIPPWIRRTVHNWAMATVGGSSRPRNNIRYSHLDLWTTTLLIVFFLCFLRYFLFFERGTLSVSVCRQRNPQWHYNDGKGSANFCALFTRRALSDLAHGTHHTALVLLRFSTIWAIDLFRVSRGPDLLFWNPLRIYVDALQRESYCVCGKVLRNPSVAFIWKSSTEWYLKGSKARGLSWEG